MAKLPKLLTVMLVMALPAAAEDVVARIGGTEVTVSELKAYLDGLPPADQAAIARDPALLPQAARIYLANRLVLKEAKDKKFDQRSETRTQLDRVRDAALTELYLQSAARLPDNYPSEAEVQAAYEASKSGLIPPRSYRLAQIFVAAPTAAKGSAKLDELAKRLKARGADFAAIARELSDNRAEAERDGEIGWLTEPQLVPPIARALADAEKGTVTEPLRLDDGWHVIKLLEIKASSQPLPLAEVRDILAEKLRQQRAAQMRQAYLTELLRQNPPALNELALSKLTGKFK